MAIRRARVTATWTYEIDTDTYMGTDISENEDLESALQYDAKAIADNEWLLEELLPDTEKENDLHVNFSWAEDDFSWTEEEGNASNEARSV